MKSPVLCDVCFEQFNPAERSAHKRSIRHLTEYMWRWPGCVPETPSTSYEAHVIEFVKSNRRQPLFGLTLFEIQNHYWKTEIYNWLTTNCPQVEIDPKCYDRQMFEKINEGHWNILSLRCAPQREGGWGTQPEPLPLSSALREMSRPPVLDECQTNTEAMWRLTKQILNRPTPSTKSLRDFIRAHRRPIEFGITTYELSFHYSYYELQAWCRQNHCVPSKNDRHGWFDLIQETVNKDVWNPFPFEGPPPREGWGKQPPPLPSKDSIMKRTREVVIHDVDDDVDDEEVEAKRIKVSNRPKTHKKKGLSLEEKLSKVNERCQLKSSRVNDATHTCTTYDAVPDTVFASPELVFGEPMHSQATFQRKGIILRRIPFKRTYSTLMYRKIVEAKDVHPHYVLGLEGDAIYDVVTRSQTTADPLVANSRIVRVFWGRSPRCVLRFLVSTKHLGKAGTEKVFVDVNSLTDPCFELLPDELRLPRVLELWPKGEPYYHRIGDVNGGGAPIAPYPDTYLTMQLCETMSPPGMGVVATCDIPPYTCFAYCGPWSTATAKKPTTSCYEYSTEMSGSFDGKCVSRFINLYFGCAPQPNCTFVEATWLGKSECKYPIIFIMTTQPIVKGDPVLLDSYTEGWDISIQRFYIPQKERYASLFEAKSCGYNTSGIIRSLPEEHDVVVFRQTPTEPRRFGRIVRVVSHKTGQVVPPAPIHVGKGRPKKGSAEACIVTEEDNVDVLVGKHFTFHEDRNYVAFKSGNSDEMVRIQVGDVTKLIDPFECEPVIGEPDVYRLRASLQDVLGV